MRTLPCNGRVFPFAVWQIFQRRLYNRQDTHQAGGTRHQFNSRIGNARIDYRQYNRSSRQPTNSTLRSHPKKLRGWSWRLSRTRRTLNRSKLLLFLHRRSSTYSYSALSNRHLVTNTIDTNNRQQRPCRPRTIHRNRRCAWYNRRNINRDCTKISLRRRDGSNTC